MNRIVIACLLAIAGNYSVEVNAAECEQPFTQSEQSMTENGSSPSSNSTSASFGCGEPVSPPNAPSNLSGPTSDADGTFTLTFTASTGFSVGGNYRLERSLNSSAYNNSVTIGRNETSYDVIDLAPGSYTYRLKGCNPDLNNGGPDACSAWTTSNSITVEVETWDAPFTWTTSTHNEIVGDFDNNGVNDVIVQPKITGDDTGLFPVLNTDTYINTFHKAWTNAHPEISAIEDWSEESYGVYSGNFTSEPGDELLMLGTKQIILLHGDIITPITIFQPVRNAIVSWNASNVASYSEFEFDANPADFVVHVGDLTSDGLDEIFLQAKSSGGTSYILSNTGSLIQTISNGYRNVEWSAASYDLEIVNGAIVMTALKSADDDNIAYTGSAGSITSLDVAVTKPTLSGTSQKYVFESSNYSFTPTFTSSATTNTFSATGMPSWMSINSSTGELSGTPSASDIDQSSSIKLTIHEEKTHTVDVTMTVSIEVVESFTISETGYTVYETNDGTLYLVSDNGVDVYKVIDDAGVNIILESSIAEFNSSGAVLLEGYNAQITDQNADGTLDLVLSPGVGYDHEPILVSDILGTIHTVLIGGFVEVAPAPHVEPIPNIDINSQKVGTVQGTFRVDESGAATYSIPLSLPVGTAGVMPELAIGYSSSGANGILGKGWNLSGISAITRCKQTQESDGTDALMRGIEFRNTDRFCLDGQRLVLVSGVYGENGSQYTTEINSFQKIIAHGTSGYGPSYFEVRGKDGAIKYYGDSSDSQLLANASGIALQTVATWSLNRTEDRQGNYITYEYNNDDQLGIQEILKISYTGNENLSPYNFVHFGYETRADERYYMARSSQTLVNRRVNQIRIETPHPTTDVATTVKRYEFEYQQSSSNNVSLLTSIEECSGDSDDTCLLPTEFSWEEGINGFPSLYDSHGNATSSGDWTIKAVDPIDFNGDGKGDVVVLKKRGGDYYMQVAEVSSEGLNYSPYHTLMPSGEKHQISGHVGDFDGDGKFDVLAPYRVFANDDWTYAIYKGSEMGLAEKVDTGIPYDLTDRKKQWTVGDMNGDGLPDLVRLGSVWVEGLTWVPGIAIRFNEGGTFAEEIVEPIEGAIGENDHWGVEYIDSIQDITGNGKQDIIFTIWACFFECTPGPSAYQKSVVYNEISDEEGFKFRGFKKSPYAEYAEYLIHDTIFIDINGDGLLDQLRKWNDDISVWIQGSDYEDFETIINSGLSENFNNIHTIDYNGDGLMDIVFPNLDGDTWEYWNVLLSNGRTLSETIQTSLVARDVATRRHLFSDFDGDGQIDNLYFGDDKKYGLKFGLKSEAPKNTITRFTNGLGEFQEVTYLPLTDDSVYTKGAGANNLTYGNGSPVFDINGPIYVVSNAISSAPDYLDETAVASVSYLYENARIQSGGRGFLGFEKIYSIDDELGIVTGTKYRQDFPFVGSPSETVVGYSQTAVDDYFDSGSQTNIISATATDWVLKSVSNGYTDFPYLETSTHEQFLGGLPQITVTTQSVDDYGNVLATNETLHESRGSVEYFTRQTATTNKYDEDDVGNWILGRLTETEVVVTRPDQDQSVVPPITRVSKFHYDSVTGQLEYETINPEDTSNQLRLTTAYSYDEFGNILRTTQCSGHISAELCGSSITQDANDPYFINRYSRNVWDNRGRFVDASYNALEQKVTEVLERHITGQATKASNLDGVVVDKAYDAHGRLYFERSSIGGWSLIEQALLTDASGEPTGFSVTKTGSGTPASTEQFDKLGRSILSHVTAFDGINSIYVSRTYDSRGRLHFESIPSYTQSNTTGTSYTYDDFGRPISTVHPDGTSSVDYGDEFSITSTNQINQTKTEERNALGELLGSYENGNSHLKTTYGYDASGKLRRTTDVNSIDTAIITYDVLGRKIAMVDVDTGSWTYDYNALGELVEQTDAKGQKTELFYDLLGRKVKRVESGGIATEAEWFYDSHNSISYPGKLVAEEDTTSGYSKTYDYDSLGRLEKTTTHIPAMNGIAAQDYVERVTFDEYGRVFQQFDISGNEAGQRFVYDSNGYLTMVRDTRHDSDTFFYQIKEMNAFGKVTQVEMGNGVVSNRVFNPDTGLLEKIQTGEGNSIQDLEYGFNAIGRLERRHSTTLEGGLHIEEFDYDDLNRLKTAEIINSSLPIMSLTYDDNGNIKTKSDVGSAQYDYTNNHASCSYSSSSIHAVKQIGTRAYCYDANGNRVKTLNNGVETRSVSYSNFNKPLVIDNQENNHTTSFNYGTSRQRFSRTDSNADGVKTIHYIGNVEVHYKTDGSVEYKRSVGGRAIVTVNANSVDTKYLHKDYQGSITAITDHVDGQTVAVVQRMSFDPFGKRRTAVTWDQMTIAQQLMFDHEITTRGYTGHEMLDEVGIIHMNGRTYDAEIGRFMQADPMVQEPGNGQNLNRYSYVLNSPMSYTDPSGYFHYQVPVKPKTNYGLIAFQIILAVATQGQSVYWQMGVQAAFTYAVTGDLRASATAAFTTWMMSTIGSNFSGGEKIAAHAVGGGISSVLQGGKFGHGFVSSLAVSLAAGPINGMSSKGGQVIASAIVGGTISAATGGKFANGAVTSAFRWAFNELSHKDVSDMSDGELAEAGNIAVGLEGKVKIDNFFELAASGKFGDDGIKIKSALGQGKRVRISIDNNGVAKVTIKGDKSFSLTTDLGAQVDTKVSGLKVAIATKGNGNLIFKIGGQVKYPGVAEFYGGAFFELNTTNYVMTNSGLLGIAARALRDRGQQIERQIREAGG